MSTEIARPAETQFVSRFRPSDVSTTEAAQPSTFGEEHPAAGFSGEARRTFSSNLSQLEVARAAEEVNWRGNAVPPRAVTRRLSLKSEQMVASKIEQLELAQLKSPQLKELVSRLKFMYRIETPKPEKLTKKAQHPYADFRVAERWQELQGCSRWDGLLDPIDPVLKAEVVRYGEFAQAAYDAFDGDTTSKYCGSCKYTKEQLLETCGLENRGYEITQYLYATAELDLPNFFLKSSRDDKWSKDSNWMGFVAVCTSPEEIARLGRRDIVVAWRGTITRFEWIKDVQDWLSPAGFDPRNGHKDVMVETGFLNVYKSSNVTSRYNKKSAREQVLAAVRDLIQKYKDEGTQMSITVTGHSLGSALATLCGYDIAESGINRLLETSPSVPTSWNSRKSDWEATAGASSTSSSSSSFSESVSTPAAASRKPFPNDRIPITVFSFAGPRVGNRAFKDRVEELADLAILRVVNKHDLVTKVPGVLLPEIMELAQRVISVLPSYKSVGVKLKLDNSLSPFLEDPENPIHAHNLEGYLHGVDGFHATTLPFKPTMRDFALVNKGGDYLKRELYIPAAWWQEAYKGLVKDVDGHWVLPPRSEEIWPDTPVEDPSPEVDKHRQLKAFWRSVSIALEMSASRARTPSASAPKVVAPAAGFASPRDVVSVDGVNSGVSGDIADSILDAGIDAAK